MLMDRELTLPAGIGTIINTNNSRKLLSSVDRSLKLYYLPDYYHLELALTDYYNEFTICLPQQVTL